MDHSQHRTTYQQTRPWSSPYDPGAYANIWQGERSGTQGRAPQTLTFQSKNKIIAESHTAKD